MDVSRLGAATGRSYRIPPRSRGRHYITGSQVPTSASLALHW